MSFGIHLENVAIVLNGPKYPENVGSTARAMKNMGLKDLVVVSPLNPDMEKMLRMATHAAKDIIETMAVFDDLHTALAPFHWIVGTTARLGGKRPVTGSPEKLMRDLVPISAENRIAFMFGPEDRGLTNEDLRYCQTILNIPTAGFSSLNVSQAVMVLCYEIYKTRLKAKPEFVPRLAGRHELDGMFGQLKDILIRINYINDQNPDYWMNKIRHFCTRMRFTAKEVAIIRGICRQINWYAGKMRREGYADAVRENHYETDTIRSSGEGASGNPG